MDNLLQWEQDWQMEFHPSKCQLLRITNKRKPFDRDYDIHGHKLEEVESTKRMSTGISTSTKSQKGELHQSLYPAEPKSLPPERRNPLAI